MNLVEWTQGRDKRRAALAAMLVLFLIVATLAAVAWEPPGEAPATAATAPDRDSADLTATAAPADAAPLVLSGDEALLQRAVRESWPGRGTVGDPIRITALAIIATEGPAIRLQGTTLQVNIEGNRFILPNATTIIELDDAQNITITDNHFEGAGTGVKIVGGADNIVRRNEFALLQTALALERTGPLLIDGNTFGASGTGVAFTSGEDGRSHHARISNNTFAALDTALRLEGAHHRVERNGFEAMQRTAIAGTGHDLLIRANGFVGMADGAIDLHGSKRLVVQDNSFDAGDGPAIRLNATADGMVASNRFGPHPEGAILSDEDARLEIRGNHFEATDRAVAVRGGIDLLIVENHVERATQAFDLSRTVRASVVRNEVLLPIVSAINVFGGSGARIEENTISGAGVWGLYVTRASGVHADDNTIRETPFGVGIADGSTDVGLHGNQLLGAGTTAISVLASARTRIEATDIAFHTTGIHIGPDSTDTQVVGGFFRKNTWGVVLDAGSKRSTLEAFHVTQAAVGIFATKTSGNTLRSVDVQFNSQGMLLLETTDNVITHSRFYGNRLGIHYVNSSSNLFYDNIVRNDHFPGDRNILLEDSAVNLWNTTRRAGTNVVGGAWIGGNMWHDYGGPDADGDGIGDVPYRPVPYIPILEVPAQADSVLVGPLDMRPLMDPAGPAGPPSPPDPDDPIPDLPPGPL